jgi:hypothetical protein
MEPLRVYQSGSPDGSGTFSDSIVPVPYHRLAIYMGDIHIRGYSVRKNSPTDLQLSHTGKSHRSSPARKCLHTLIISGLWRPSRARSHRKPLLLVTSRLTFRRTSEVLELLFGQNTAYSRDRGSREILISCVCFSFWSGGGGQPGQLGTRNCGHHVTGSVRSALGQCPSPSCE